MLTKTNISLLFLFMGVSDAVWNTAWLPGSSQRSKGSGDFQAEYEVSKILNEQRELQSDNSTRINFRNDTLISDYIAVDEWDQLYFMLAESRNDPKTDPLVIWLTGGPGCSSMLAFFTENGPYNYRYSKTGTERALIDYNPNSWNNKANVLYLDQPVGTGFSFAKGIGSYRFSEEQIAQDFHAFIAGFLEKYPEFSGLPIFLTGESFAGHYIPAIASYLHELGDEAKFELSGLAIGNGWVDPFYQYPGQPKFASENDIITPSHASVLKPFYSLCQYALILGVPMYSDSVCMFAGMTIATPVYPKFNLYDIRLPCKKLGTCYEDDYMADMMNSYEYRTLMKINNDQDAWQMCGVLPHLFLMGDLGQMAGHKLTKLLDTGMPILIYSGDKDYICNWRGGELWTNALVWTGQDEFNNAEYEDWVISDEEKYWERKAGEKKSYKNFEFLRIYDSGHMVPMDQPEAAEIMLNQFIDSVLNE